MDLIGAPTEVSVAQGLGLGYLGILGISGIAGNC